MTETPTPLTTAHPYASFLHRVEKPARYAGGEMNQVRKDPSTVDVSMCLAFPDLYDIGMSHLGTKILYSVLNKHPRIACERAFTPWVDMERELRARGLPLVSLESARPLRDFDAVGCSLQYEMTYTNVLTLLDLSGIPLRAQDRQDGTWPLILAGGPCATHPEAVAPFFDAFLVGDAEARLPELLLRWKADRVAGHSRREALIRMAQAGGVYVPELYEVAEDARSGLLCVTRPIDERVPARVTRAFVPDINAFPFPSDSPVAAAQAIFDRLSIEIARGCTEGCRLCQAGMIYRPVRERDPKKIISTVLTAIDQGGYDEASLTSLSTADYSCVDPLIRGLMGELRSRNVSLSVSSLRAYGLNDGLLDEIKSVRATGLTFAPEAGTQRMRDVVNKNISEEDLAASAHRIFSRGWDKMKCYFMIGLPTEQDEDVVGIVQTAARQKAVGRGYIRKAEVTASVSSHVPKPHTPFQWAAMDTIPELKRKQWLLRDAGRYYNVPVKFHDARISYLEGIVSRGDRRVSDLIEAAWKGGCRFDGWDEQLKFEAWMAAMEALPGFDPTRYLGTLPLDGGLPWDHLDVGLADGFLAMEWKRTLKNKASPPCGKPVGMQVHHTNVAQALADKKKLVCYHCGVACDMTQMREERVGFLSEMGALEAPVIEPEAPSPEVEAPVETPTDKRWKAPRPPVRENAAKPEDLVRYRLQYVKTGLIRLQGHTDMLRILPRVWRRAGVPVGYSWGFHPKPLMTFSPALALGTYSVGELVEVALTEAVPLDTLLTRLNAAADPGLAFVGGRVMEHKEPNLAYRLEAADYLAVLPGIDREAAAVAVMRFMGAERVPMTVRRKEEERTLDARASVAFLRLADAALWPELVGPRPEGALVQLRMREGGGVVDDVAVPPTASVRPREILAAAFGAGPSADDATLVRLGFWRRDEDGVLRSPLEPRPATLPPVAVPEASLIA